VAPTVYILLCCPSSNGRQSHERSVLAPAIVRVRTCVSRVSALLPARAIYIVLALRLSTAWLNRLGLNSQSPHPFIHSASALRPVLFTRRGGLLRVRPLDLRVRGYVKAATKRRQYHKIEPDVLEKNYCLSQTRYAANSLPRVSGQTVRSAPCESSVQTPQGVVVSSQSVELVPINWHR